MVRLLTTVSMALSGLLMVPGAPAAGPEFAVIVHRSNPVESLSLSDLRAMLTGVAARWPNRNKVVLAERGSESAATAFLTQRLLKTTWPDYKRNLANLEFMGAEPVTLRVLNSDPAACKFVFNVPASLGFIEVSSLSAPECRDVRVLKIEGRLPGQPGYRLQ